MIMVVYVTFKNCKQIQQKTFFLLKAIVTLYRQGILSKHCIWFKKNNTIFFSSFDRLEIKHPLNPLLKVL